VALRIFERLEKPGTAIHDLAETRATEMMNYHNLILGIPTWGIGEIQDDWLAVFPGMESLDLRDKTVALFGLGDQESYPDTFADALGKLLDALGPTGCRIKGRWPSGGYDFENSLALRGGEFVGLVLDEDNQAELTELRIRDWLGALRLS